MKLGNLLFFSTLSSIIDLTEVEKKRRLPPFIIPFVASSGRRCGEAVMTVIFGVVKGTVDSEVKLQNIAIIFKLWNIASRS